MSCILLTGVTGYLGKRILPHLQADRIIASGRGDRPTDLPKNVDWLQWDLADVPHLDAETLQEITRVIHCSAVTRFNVEEGLADRINRDGSRRVFALARRCENLRSLDYISTLYASGLNEGKIPESPLVKRPDFANHYERSKWETEDLLVREFEDLPWNIYRVATILGDNIVGDVTQKNAVHNTLKLLYYGLISIVPGKKSTPIYLVSGDFCAKCIAKTENVSHQVFHLCGPKESCLNLEQLIDIAFDEFSKDESFVKRGIKKPLFVDEESFALLSSGVSGFGGDVLKEALGSVSPFARQLFIEKNFELTNSRKFTPDSEDLPTETFLRNCLKTLVKRKWK